VTVSQEYRQFVLEQLNRVAAVTARNMFGGVGIYSNGMMFALIDDDTLYLKVDDTNRGEFEAAGSGAFDPYGDGRVMQYYELPADALEDVDALRSWIDKAIAVAASARRKKKK
jgi:DNA transformation protein